MREERHGKGVREAQLVGEDAHGVQGRCGMGQRGCKVDAIEGKLNKGAQGCKGG